MTTYQVPIKAGESWFWARLRRHLGELLRLAVPVVISRLSIITMAMVDTLFVARYSDIELAYQSIGSAPTGSVLMISIGLILGSLVVTSNAYGVGDYRECGAVLRRSIPYAFGIGLVGTILCLFGTPFLMLTGQEPDIAVGGGEVIWIIGLGLPWLLIFNVGVFFLEGTKRPLPGMIMMLAANLLNVLLNWILVFGHWGFPAMGASGSAWATTSIRIFLVAVMLVYLASMRDREKFGLGLPTFGNWSAWRPQRRIGYAAGVSIGLEGMSFAVLNLFAGLIGVVALGGFAIAFNILALFFMVALGLASATAVRVGIAYGRKDAPDIALAGWTGLGVNTFVMIVFGGLIAVFSHDIAALFSTDPRLVSLAGALIAFSAFILVVDGGQVVSAHALRGRHDNWVPTVSHAVSYFGVMVPAGWILAIELGRGAMGLFEAVLIGSAVSFGLLTFRFFVLCRRDRRAMQKAEATS
ncbi:MAG: MATE family efflux transporter [Pseudomonadota bacterium]